MSLRSVTEWLGRQIMRFTIHEFAENHGGLYVTGSPLAFRSVRTERVSLSQ